MRDDKGATDAQRAFREELLSHELLISSGVAGLFGWGATFTSIVAGVEACVTRAAQAEQVTQMSFPPLIPRAQLERSGYLRSFPHLAGTVFAFEGGEEDAARLGDLVAAGTDWSDTQTMSDLALTPAACYPVYPAIASRGAIPPGGITVDTGGAYAFRHEPSADPARQQMFHIRELVRFGLPEEVASWRDRWRDAANALISSLGLEVQDAVASDPFFGRGGRLLARSQEAQSLKHELQVDLGGKTKTAIASVNYHQDHFASLYGLKMDRDDSPTHTACLGFGLERIALALLWQHGLAVTRWPLAVREALDLL